MSTNILDVLPGEEVVFSNSLATITRNCIVVADAVGQGQTILSLSRVSRIRKVTITYPVFLVIASAVLLIAAAALSSKEGNGAGLPIALLGFLLIFFFIGSRRGSVVFTADGETVETSLGSVGEATALIAALDGMNRRAPAPEPDAEMLETNTIAS